MFSYKTISDVFRTSGQPDITYVKRDNGRLEGILSHALSENGQICLITGPSKTGKTTLYRNVLEGQSREPLIIPCDSMMDLNGFWRRALEAIKFERLESRAIGTSRTSSVGGEGQLKFGWRWITEVTGKISGNFARTQTETDARMRILADPGPDLLLPVLLETNSILIIEDFHYLAEGVKRALFQQLKRFVDSSVSIIVLSTSHRAVDISKANKDLIGRITQIDVGHWSSTDLGKICTQGFDFMNIKVDKAVISKISTESVGLPLVVQQICLQLFLQKKLIYTTDVTKNVSFKHDQLYDALHSVATTKYQQFSSYYNVLIRGPRERARRYETYSVILSCFELDPIQFALTRSEIDKRIQTLDFRDREVPPAASVTSTLNALMAFQAKRGIELLEWVDREQTLYMLEPSFLFFVRWRNIRDPEPRQLSLWQMLFQNRLGRTKIQKIDDLN